MIISGDVTDPVYQVRLLIGDTDEELVHTQVILDWLNLYGGNVRKVSIEALKAILAQLTNQLSIEQVGQVRIEYGKLYDNKYNLLERIKNDPSYISGMFNIIIGGTSKSKKEEYEADDDLIKAPISAGFYTGDN